MIDHNFYASPVQASQTLITHILEAMDKELERPFTIAFPEGLLLPHFLWVRALPKKKPNSILP